MMSGRCLTPLGVLLFFSLLFNAVTPLKGDVFSLWPFGKKDSVSKALAGGLPVTGLWSEPVNVNGVDLSLELSLLACGIEDCIDFLRQNYPGANFAKNANMFLASIKMPEGGIRKLLFIQMPPPCPVIQFSINLPSQIPNKFSWPTGLPLPSGATPLTSMALGNRNALFGHFETPQPPEQALSEMKASLVANGWQASTSESSSSLGGKGEIFIKGNPPAIMIISLSQKDGQATKGSVYTKPLK